ncbi:protein-glutamate methylesterase/protein-glutamine glutaminase [Limisalsivibrio acetivorans]|uniref:protein-glutamate methylesterase/protein-glutamine glutaminase n=1 Tax=Limisalsivibrio acetivorans TaxID=1304888 RepID=UPI0003B75A06|nr:chemotaxis response regulator protein-glutamate methylesterase [Limisalsivibrio acetivorans]
MAIRVLVVDDSATARAMITDVLSKDSHIEVIGAAPDPYVARDMIVKHKPDVICLDVEMPRMDGITFLRKIMQHMPTPVVMVSSLTKKGAKVTLDALDAGAVDFVSKPHMHIYDGIGEMEKELIEKVKNAAHSNLKKTIAAIKQTPKKEITTALGETTNKVIAIGASTGGTVALQEVLTVLPPNSPGIVIVQHMPQNFTAAFAERLNDLCRIEVREAKHGDIVGVGTALIAPGELHMVVKRTGGRYYVEVGTGKKVSGHRPSVDVLFNSVSKYVGSNAVGAILTGMGSDGAKGLLKMKNSGAKTVAQDSQSCVVYGMPKVAVELGAADYVESLRDIPERLMELVSK